MNLKPGNIAILPGLAVTDAATAAGGAQHVTESFRNVSDQAPVELERMVSVRNQVKERWRMVPTSFAENGPMDYRTAEQGMIALSPLTGLLEAYSESSDENIIRLFDGFLAAEETLGKHAHIPGIETIVRLAWRAFLNGRTPPFRVTGYLNEVARIGALLASGRRITGVGVEMPEITVRAWSSRINRSSRIIWPKKLTLRPEIDVLEEGKKGIEIKYASFAKRTFREYTLRLFEQGVDPKDPIRIPEERKVSPRLIESAIRFVNQLIYYRELMDGGHLEKMEYLLTSVKRVPEELSSAVYAFLGEENFRFIQYDGMFSREGTVI